MQWINSSGPHYYKQKQMHLTKSLMKHRNYVHYHPFSTLQKSTVTSLANNIYTCVPASLLSQLNQEGRPQSANVFPFSTVA